MLYRTFKNKADLLSYRDECRIKFKTLFGYSTSKESKLNEKVASLLGAKDFNTAIAYAEMHSSHTAGDYPDGSTKPHAFIDEFGYYLPTHSDNLLAKARGIPKPPKNDIDENIKLATSRIEAANTLTVKDISNSAGIIRGAGSSGINSAGIMRGAGSSGINSTGLMRTPTLNNRIQDAIEGYGHAQQANIKIMSDLGFTISDYLTAEKEGWCINSDHKLVDTSPYMHRPDDVWRVVAKKAMKGSKFHKRVLAIVSHNPIGDNTPYLGAKQSDELKSAFRELNKYKPLDLGDVTQAMPLSKAEAFTIFINEISEHSSALTKEGLPIGNQWQAHFQGWRINDKWEIVGVTPTPLSDTEVLDGEQPCILTTKEIWDSITEKAMRESLLGDCLHRKALRIIMRKNPELYKSRGCDLLTEKLNTPLPPERYRKK